MGTVNDTEADMDIIKKSPSIEGDFLISLFILLLARRLH